MASLASIADDLDSTVNAIMDSAVSTFITRTQMRFDAGEGFYSWRGLRYFLYEYEFGKSIENNIQKVDWNLFTRVEKERITIEHILPQTPTKWYWRNAFRAYSAEEIKLLSASLGNLLPLSQSINASLQNDSFPDKRNPSTVGRRGYINGSHSEIEVAQETDWTAQNILDRGISLLGFMESRWDIAFTEEQKSELLHVSFVNYGRDEPPELPEAEIAPPDDNQSSAMRELSDVQSRRLDFWNKFVDYCKANGRGNDIAVRKAGYANWYDIPIGSPDYHIFLQLYRQDTLRIGLYVYRSADFERLESRKDDIKEVYGSELEWYTSRTKSTAKRILHSIEADIYNPNLYQQHFDWLIEQHDKLLHALDAIDSISSGR
jgi:hypothetical protein